MLLGSERNSSSTPTHLNENLVVLLLNQGRYAEAYTILNQDAASGITVFFNLALCHFWAEDYDEALHCLDRIEPLAKWREGDNIVQDAAYHKIEIKQRGTNDHLEGLSNDYLKLFGVKVRDHLIRLKTDCWIALGNYSKVIETATPIEHKGYLNIVYALKTAREKL